MIGLRNHVKKSRTADRYRKLYLAAKPTRDLAELRGEPVSALEKMLTLQHEFNRLAGYQRIDPRHPLWRSVENFLWPESASTFRETEPQSPVELMALITEARSNLRMTSGARQFLDQLAEMIHLDGGAA